jgi:hypothetical protein
MQLTVDQCLDLYSNLAQKVFGQKRWGWGVIQSKFDSKTLENVVIETLEIFELKKEETMLDHRGNACKTYAFRDVSSICAY